MEILNYRNQISNLIRDWIKNNPLSNISDFSRKSGVAESSIRRIFTNDDTGSISIENLIKICITLSGNNKLSSLHLNFSDPLKSKILEFTKLFSHDEAHLKYDRETTSETELNNSLEDFHTYLVYKRISHEDGVSKENIAQWYGEIGLNCLDSLIQKELVLQSNGVLLVKYPYFSLPLSLVKNHAGKLIDLFYKPETQYNLMSSMSGSVNVDGYGDIIDILSEAKLKIEKVFELKKGNIPTIAIGFADTMTSKLVFKNSGGSKND